MNEINEAISCLSSNWVQVVVAVFLVVMVYCGYHRGLIRMSASFVSILITTVLTRLLHPYVTEWMSSNAVLQNFVEKRVESVLASSAGMNTLGNAGGSAAGQVDQLYRLLGVDQLTDYLAGQISGFIVTAISFILMLIVVNLVVRIVFYVLDFVMKLPGLSLMNRLSGALIGFVEAVFYIWILLIVAAILPGNAVTGAIAEQFSREGSWLCYLRQANLIVRVFSGLVI